MLLTRRDAIRRTTAAGIGLVAAGATRTRAQTFAPIPSWNTELRQLAPNVYAYTQATGPGVNNASLSNAGLIVGPDTCWRSMRSDRQSTPRRSAPRQ